MNDEESIKTLNFIKICPLCNRETEIFHIAHARFDTDIKAVCDCGFCLLCWKFEIECE